MGRLHQSILALVDYPDHITSSQEASWIKAVSRGEELPKIMISDIVASEDQASRSAKGCSRSSNLRPDVISSLLKLNGYTPRPIEASKGEHDIYVEYAVFLVCQRKQGRYTQQFRRVIIIVQVLKDTLEFHKQCYR